MCYTKNNNLLKLSILSLAKRQGAKFPASTAVAVLAFPSLHRVKVPNVVSNDTERTLIPSTQILKKYFVIIRSKGMRATSKRLNNPSKGLHNPFK